MIFQLAMMGCVAFVAFWVGAVYMYFHILRAPDARGQRMRLDELSDRDACEFCMGGKGGTLGHEKKVMLSGRIVTVCKYCYQLTQGGRG